MQQNETRPELSSTQQVVMRALLAGETMTDAATSADVHRSTVHRWVNDPVFLAELNSLRSELAIATIGRLRQLQLQAVATVESALVAGDVKTALTVLQGGGYLDGQRQVVGSTDPEQIAKSREAQARNKALLDKLLDR